MALEAGEMMHQVFAGVRIWQLWKKQGLEEHAHAVGRRIFKQRWNDIWKSCVTHTDERESLMEMCFTILHSAGWKDDEKDNNRTMTNMELATIVYVDEHLPKMENWPIYVENERDSRSMVGIEQVFDVVLYYADDREIRYIGTIDGLVIKKATGHYHLDENKTASRISQDWRNAFDLRHQITGYCAASTSVFGFRVLRSRVTGLRIKPANRGEDVYPFEPIERTEDAIQHWATWVREMADTYDRYKDDFENATRNTHSCNRYFRACSLLQFCCDTVEGRRLSYDSQMVPADPSPSERAIGD